MLCRNTSDTARKMAFAASIGIGMALSNVNPAIAAPQYHTFSVTKDLRSETFGFDQFDPALGTLIQVAVTNPFSDLSLYSIVAVTVGPANPYYFQSGTMTVLGPNGRLLSYDFALSAYCGRGGNTNAPLYCYGVDDYQDWGFLRPLPSATALYASSDDLAAFIGSGTVNFTVSIESYRERTDFSGDPAYNFSLNVASYSPTIGLEYTYVANAAVAEPTSMAVLTTALGLTCLVRRRQKT